MPKIAIIGAGSHEFAAKLVADVLHWPSLRDSTISLMDINSERLDTMAALAGKMVKQMGTGARIQATTNLEEALDGSDYVSVSIRVGATHNNVTIPAGYGIDQAIGDTNGPGGVFYFLRNAPALVHIAETMARVSPHAIMLNYSNPMGMLSWAVKELTGIQYVGLCHSVQGTAMALARYLKVPFEDVSYWAAGINHMAWYLEYRARGKDAYPLLYKAMEDPDVYERDIVRFEVLKYFGAFVSESSVHMSEYVPYFRRTKELIERHSNEKMWGVGPGGAQGRAERRKANAERRVQSDREMHDLAHNDAEISMALSHEYFSRILNAIETNVPFTFNGNVPNTRLITNLPASAIVEVPILTDATGLHPCYVGDLPPALAALNSSNLWVQELAVRGFIERDREHIYKAVQLDPLTASILPLDMIRQMTDEMFAADAEFIHF